MDQYFEALEKSKGSIALGITSQLGFDETAEVLEKGRRAAIGEVRTWSDGERYIKTSQDWVPVKNNPQNYSKDREFVSWLHEKLSSQFYRVKPMSKNFVELWEDEDTGESFEIERTPEQVYESFSASKKAEMQAQKMRERDLRELAEQKEKDALQLKYLQAQKEWDKILIDEKQILSDMENDPEVLAENGNGGSASDRYGDLLNEIDERKRKHKELYSSYQDAWQKEGRPVNRESYEHKRSGTGEDLEREIDENGVSRLVE